VKRLRPEDVASVVVFGDTVNVLEAFTADRSALEQAIRRARAGGSTRLYNALYVGLKELTTPAEGDDGNTPRRRVAVLLTDGDDTASLVRFEDVLDFAKRSRIAIYAIRLGTGSHTPAARASNREAQYVLNQLTRQTGGRAFLSLEEEELRSVYDGIRDELAHQYALGYVSSDERKDGRFRRLHVQVLRGGARARTRAGYFAPLAILTPPVWRR
jgi:Ca-activated chloride channel family protein